MRRASGNAKGPAPTGNFQSDLLVTCLNKLAASTASDSLRNVKIGMKAKSTVADADMSMAGRALERAAARARQLSEQTGTPLYVLKDGRVVDLNRSSGGSYLLREERSGK